MSVKHKEEALKEAEEVKVAIIVVSTSRYEKKIRGEPFEDESGEIAKKIIEKYGYTVTCKEIVPDDKGIIQMWAKKRIEEGDDAIIFIGGTGLSKTDLTYEAIMEILEKEMEGFGEIFRMLSYREIGSAAIMSRATAGILNGRLLVAIPGSPNAIPIALEKLLLPELRHIIFHARRK
ncbi:MAG: molybdenum cofactor biosynthesis protein MoaB [Candidatus Verstraetearchaeota archaeon]|nr:molybdenum cofactor biosynthesis protein MoaB [Candidatus Verstraetearchaeota archaeon]